MSETHVISPLLISLLLPTPPFALLHLPGKPSYDPVVRRFVPIRFRILRRVEFLGGGEQNTKRATKNRAIPHSQSIGIEKNRQIDRREIYPATTGNSEEYRDTKKEGEGIVGQHNLQHMLPSRTSTTTTILSS